MGVTFSVVDGPTRQVHESDHTGALRFNDDGSPFMYDEPILEVVDVSYTTARAMLAAIGTPLDVNGHCWKLRELPCLQLMIRVAIHRNVSSHTRAASDTVGSMRVRSHQDNVSHIGKGCRVVDMGLDAQQLTERLTRLLRLVEQAREYKLGLSYG